MDENEETHARLIDNLLRWHVLDHLPRSDSRHRQRPEATNESHLPQIWLCRCQCIACELTQYWPYLALLNAFLEQVRNSREQSLLRELLPQLKDPSVDLRTAFHERACLRWFHSPTLTLLCGTLRKKSNWELHQQRRELWWESEVSHWSMLC